MVEACPRCWEARGEGRWCANCGLDSTPTAGTLPTQEATDAGIRERDWLGSDSKAAREQERRREAARRAESEGRASARPEGLDAYRDPSTPARLAKTWLAIMAGLTALVAALEIGHLNLISGKTTAGMSLSVAQQVDEDSHTLATVYILVLIAHLFCAAFFVAWTWRAYRNVTALGAQRLRFGTGWAIGGWFVPILGLWRPKQIVDDIWRTSEPTAPAALRPHLWRDTRTSALLAWWWAFFVIANIVDRIASRMPSETIEQHRSAITWDLVADLLTIVAAGLAILVITRITARQRGRSDVLRSLPPKPPVSDSPPKAATAPAT